MKVLVLGLDGADHELVSDLLAEGKLPTIGRLARDGAWGPLRSTIPAVTPTAWSSFSPASTRRARNLQLLDQPEPQPQRVESAASRAGSPLWRRLGAAGLRSAFVAIPFTYPAEPIDGIVVTGYGGPERPEILPASAQERIFREYPDLVTAHHPMAERWWEDFAAYTTRLIEHVEQTASVCRMSLELDPAISVLCADFMSPTTPGTSAITVSIAPTPRTTRRTRVTSLSASTRRSTAPAAS